MHSGTRSSGSDNDGCTTCAVRAATKTRFYARFPRLRIAATAALITLEFQSKLVVNRHSAPSSPFSSPTLRPQPESPMRYSPLALGIAIVALSFAPSLATAQEASVAVFRPSTLILDSERGRMVIKFLCNSSSLNPRSGSPHRVRG